MQIISKAEARSQGLPRYFTGKPCRRGHVSERYAGNGNCCDCKKLRADAWEAENRISRYAQDRERYWLNRDRKLEWRRGYEKRRRREDPKFAMAAILRRHLSRLLERHGLEKKGRSEEILGYTSEDLVSHLEKQFAKGMSWDNYGEWHIDHITPVIEHVRNGETDPSVINCLTNLRPIWAKDNMSKGGKRTNLL